MRGPGIMNAHAQAHIGMRHLVGFVGFGVAILAMLVMGLIQPVGAQETPITCALFETQPEAQATLDQNPLFGENLDPDGNGVACEELPETDPSPTGDFTSCDQFESREDAQRELNARSDDSLERRFALDPDGDGMACEDTFGVGDGEQPENLRTCDDFASQEEAQAYVDNEATDLQGAILDPDGDFLACEDAFGGQVAVDPFDCGMFGSRERAQAALDADAELAEFLDEDGDGVACEELGTDGPVVVVCNTQLGTLVEVQDSEEILSQLDFPFRRATQAEIAAGTCGATVPAGDGEPEGDAGSDEVVRLPATGSGPAATAVEPGSVAAAVLTVLVLTLRAVWLRTTSQRIEP